MKIAPKSSSEEERLIELDSFGILDTEAESFFDNITEILAEFCDTPIALISLVDDSRQWFKSKVGLQAESTSREVAFCSHAILQDDVFIINDATVDPRFQDNPLVQNDPNVVFYAGAPLRSSNGYNLGTLCIIDHKPRELSSKQKALLQTLASQVVSQIEIRSKMRSLDKFSRMMEEIHSLNIQNFDTPEQLFKEYLKKGTDIYELGIGIISRVEEAKYTVLEIVTPDGSISKGAEFELKNTYCEEVIRTNSTVTYTHVGSISKMAAHPVYLGMNLESYIGTPITFQGKIYGTLSYSSREKRKFKFSPEEIKFIEILSQIITKKLEAREIQSKQKTTMESLIKEEERLELAAKSAGVGIWEWIFESRKYYWNDTMYEIYGLEDCKDNVELDFWYESIHPDDLYIIKDIIKDLGTTKSFSTEFRILKNGEVRYIKTEAKVHKNKDGKIDRVLGANWDITDEKMHELELQRSLSRFHALTDLAPVGIFLTDLDGTPTYFNPYWLQMAGLDLSKALEDGGFLTVHPDDKSRVYDKWNKIIEQQISFEEEIKIVNQKTQVISTVISKATPLRNSENEVFGFVGVNIDITKQKETENSLIVAKEKALEASRAKSMFLANMSHEIRTPLNSIVGLSDLLINSELNQHQKDFAITLQNSSEVLLSIVNDILDLSKIEAQELKLDHVPLNLQEITSKISRLFSWQLQEKRISFTITIESNLHLNYLGDPTRIHQILINLIGNAFKFTSEGHVTLSVSEDTISKNGNILITVEDTGIGISEDISDHIFMPFNQGESSITKSFGGTGLGLAITKRLVQLMDGDIWVRSTLGKGSIFSISLPLEKSNPQATNAPYLPLTDEIELSKLKERSLKILLVDDAINNRNLIVAYLKNFPFIITQAENGRLALEELKKNSFDLVLMDIQMPEMDGYTSTSLFRAWEIENSVHRIPIIALTAYALKEEQDRCIAAGCDEHLSKPIKKDKILEAISRFCK